MPWIYTNGNGTNRRRRRRSNRAYDYGTDYDRFPRYRRARRAYNNADYGDYADDDGDYDYQDNDFDGFYDRRGNPVSLVIQTPADMLPPRRAANQTADGQLYRSRARF